MNAEVRNVLAQLVAIPSFSDNLAMTAEIINYAAEYLRGCGLSVEIMTDDGHPSLVATSAGTKNPKHPKLLLQSHLDVVPCQLSQLELASNEHGHLCGRGVYDMKFAAACFLVAARELRDELATLDFGIMLTTDEETGGHHGVGYLTSQGYNADAVLLPDGGGNWQVETEARGSWSFEVTAHGVASHGARPWLGKNAIESLLQFANTVKSIVPHEKEDSSTLVISQIRGGEAVNQVPAEASATFDMRYDVERQGAMYRSQVAEAAHSDHEWIDARQLGEFYACVVDYIRRMA